MYSKIAVLLPARRHHGDWWSNEGRDSSSPPTRDLINNTKSKRKAARETPRGEKSMNMVRDVRVFLLLVKDQTPWESGHRNIRRASHASQVRRLYVNCVEPRETSGTNSGFSLTWSHCHKAWSELERQRLARNMRPPKILTDCKKFCQRHGMITTWKEICGQEKAPVWYRLILMSKTTLDVYVHNFSWWLYLRCLPSSE